MKKSATESLLSGLAYGLSVFYIFCFLFFMGLVYAGMAFSGTSHLSTSDLIFILFGFMFVVAVIFIIIGTRKGIKENNFRFESEDKKKSFSYGKIFSLFSFVFAFILLLLTSGIATGTTSGTWSLTGVFILVEFVAYGYLVFESPKIKNLKKNISDYDYHFISLGIFLGLAPILLFILGIILGSI